jgi:hypothetical protein
MLPFLFGKKQALRIGTVGCGAALLVVEVKRDCMYIGSTLLSEETGAVSYIISRVQIGQFT